MDSTTKLGLNFNSVKRAKWYQKLGYHQQQILVSLKNVRIDGGRIPGIQVLIERSYPLCFVIEGATGRSIYTQREYDKFMDKYGCSPSPSQLSKMKDSRITSFARYRVSSEGCIAAMTIWSPEKYVTIKEGDIVRLFSVMPGRSSGELCLHSTKGTKIYVASEQTSSQRTICTILPSAIKNPTELDFQGIIDVPPCEASNKSFTLLLRDAKSRLLCIMIPKRFFTVLPKLKPNQSITVFDLSFMHYDRSKEFPVYTFTDRSDIKLK